MARSASLSLPFGQVSPAEFLRSRLGRSFVSSVIEDVECCPFRLRQIGTLKGWAIAICEAPPGSNLPDYGTRRSWRLSLRGRLAEGILIFSDASHSNFVWSWFQESEGISAYRERLAPPGAVDGAGRLVSDLRNLAAFKSREPDFDGADGPLEAALFGAFGRGLPVGQSRPRTAGECQLWLETLEAPADLRRAWHRLLKFTVLDGGSDSDRRQLLEAIQLLEGIYLACLERMLAFVVDASIARVRRRSEFLRDLRTIVEAADNARSGLSRSAYARRLIFQRNVYALVDNDAEGKRLAAKLSKRFGTVDHRLRLIDLNVCSRGDFQPGAGRSRANRVRPIQPRGSASSADFGEQAEILQFAWCELRSRRLLGATSSEMAAAESQLRKRRARLLASGISTALFPDASPRFRWDLTLD